MSTNPPQLPFHRRTVRERIAALGLADGAQSLRALDVSMAERMIENVIGVFSLPYAAALRVCVDGVSRSVPLVVEEASIVAALCSAAKVTEQAGGFTTHSDESLLAGQVQLTGIEDAPHAARAVQRDKVEWIARANALCPRLRARGGGVRDVTAEVLRPDDAPASVCVNIYVDTCDAMGANTVNTLCEALAPQLIAATQANHALSILSNFTERSLFSATCRLPVALLSRHGFAGERVRDGIVSASAFAAACPHRAVTHNKGIMNGIDAVALATGNDWRAIEANAHAWAGRGAGYVPLSSWQVAEDGALVGRLQLPLKVGTRGGNFAINPTLQHSFAMLGADDADTLARTMVAVGLAQNFAALRALGTEGIQRGHMALHARSVAASAGILAQDTDAVIAAMLQSGEVSVSRAQAIAAQRHAARRVLPASAGAHAADGAGSASGKVLLFGEHAVVYGARAVALPLDVQCRASVVRAPEGGVRLRIAAWQIDARLSDEPEVGGVHHSLHILLAKMSLLRQSMCLTVEPGVPRGMGLGSSAALAVAVVRALSAAFGLNLSDEAVIELAFEAEKVAHATPSGVDNALAARRVPLVFRRGEPPHMTPLHLACPLELVIGLSDGHSSTATMVRRVRAAREQHPALYDDLFARIDSLSQQGQAALESGDLQHLGKLMNINHGLLHALDLSTSAVEDVVLTARAAGALGAKLTGGGGGGAAVALCPPSGSAAVVAALTAKGYQTLRCEVPASGAQTLRAPKENFRAG